MKIHGTYLRAFGTDVRCQAMSSTKPVRLSTAVCQRPGTSWRFVPPHMNSMIATATIAIHSAELVNWNGEPRSSSSPPDRGRS